MRAGMPADLQTARHMSEALQVSQQWACRPSSRARSALRWQRRNGAGHAPLELGRHRPLLLPSHPPHVEVRQLGGQAVRHDRRQMATRWANGVDAAARNAA